MGHALALITAKRETNSKKENHLKSLLDSIKCTNILMIRVLEEREREREREREKGAEKLFDEIMAKNILNPQKGKAIQVQDAQRAPSKIKPKRPRPRHIKIKKADVKDKERILKAAREK